MRNQTPATEHPNRDGLMEEERDGTGQSAGAVGWSFLYGRRWLGYFALLVVFSIACVWLGNWQFERRAEARAEIERIDSNYDAAPMSLAAALPDPAAFDNDEHKWQPVALHGQYIGEPFLARNRPSAAGVGSNLVQAFRNDDGSIFFVDRGWVAVSGTDEVPSDLPLPAPGEVEALVRLRAGEPEIAGRSAAGHSLPSIHLPTLAELSLKAGYAAPGAVVYTAAFGQLVSEQPEGEHGLLAERPERDEGPHLSYALQWYVFILIACIGVAYAARLEYRGLNAGDESVRREDARRADRKRRRGPSDADEEDALLGG